MGDRTRIEWTDCSWNPIRGCSRVSEGCRHCYAERQAARFAGKGQPYEGLVRRSAGYGPRWTGRVRLVEELLDAPLHWRRPRRIFVNSMSDLFHEALPFSVIAAIYGVMALTPRHTYQVLTKRPARAVEFCHWLDRTAEAAEVTFPEDSLNWRRWHILRAAAIRFLGTGPLPGIPADDPPWPLPNVWLGVSVEDQRAADERVPLLLQTPAAVRWLSMEPLLGQVNLREIRYCGALANVVPGLTLECEVLIDALTGAWDDGEDTGREAAIDWVVVGGESGPGARPMHPDWVRAIRDACVAAGVPFFFKQWGEWAPYIVTDGDPPPPLAHLPEKKLENWWTRRDVHVWESRMVAPPGLESYPVAKVSVRVGKKRAGALLDGREWREWPVVAAR